MFLGLGAVLVIGFLGWLLLASPSKDKLPSVTTTTVDTANSSKSEEMVSIQIKDFKYSPASVKVKAGGKVSVTNMDIAGHSVTADDGSFDTGVLSQNESATFRAPTTPGTYKFHCTPHPSIVGSLVVE